jgi:hypothetical protein
MGTVSLWVPLAVAALGVVGTLAATIFTQVLSGRREDARLRNERKTDRARMKREDDLRWLSQKHEALAGFLASAESLRLKLSSARFAFDRAIAAGAVTDGSNTDFNEVRDALLEVGDLLEAFYMRLIEVSLWGDPDSEAAAKTLWDCLFVESNGDPGFHECLDARNVEQAVFYRAMRRYRDAQRAALKAFRQDLGVKGDLLDR